MILMGHEDFEWNKPNPYQFKELEPSQNTKLKKGLFTIKDIDNWNSDLNERFNIGEMCLLFCSGFDEKTDTTVMSVW